MSVSPAPRSGTRGPAAEWINGVPRTWSCEKPLRAGGFGVLATGAIPSDLQRILDRLRIVGDSWLESVRHFGRWFHRSLGQRRKRSIRRRSCRNALVLRQPAAGRRSPKFSRVPSTTSPPLSLTPRGIMSRRVRISAPKSARDLRKSAPTGAWIGIWSLGVLHSLLYSPVLLSLPRRTNLTFTPGVRETDPK